jgi:hypothetical protein
MFARGSLTSRNAGKSNPYAYQVTRMPALPPTPSRSSPKVTSTLANTLVLAEGLKKFTRATAEAHVPYLAMNRCP